jgi:hypothetical protein
MSRRGRGKLTHIRRTTIGRPGDPQKGVPQVSWMRLLIHRLIHRPAAINSRIEDHIDTGRFPRGASPFQRRTDIPPLGDQLAVAAQGLNNEIGTRITQLVGDIATLHFVLGQLSIAIWFHPALFPTTPTKGKSKCTTVSISKPVRPKAPSPNSTNTSLSGKAVLAAMAKGAPRLPGCQADQDRANDRAYGYESPRRSW